MLVIRTARGARASFRRAQRICRRHRRRRRRTGLDFLGMRVVEQRYEFGRSEKGGLRNL